MQHHQHHQHHNYNDDDLDDNHYRKQSVRCRLPSQVRVSSAAFSSIDRYLPAMTLVQENQLGGEHFQRVSGDFDRLPVTRCPPTWLHILHQYWPTDTLAAITQKPTTTTKPPNTWVNSSQWLAGLRTKQRILGEFLFLFVLCWKRTASMEFARKFDKKIRWN